ncbi:MAG: hypothetical protein ACM31L_04950 [Actinomycetota bacterium]
MTSDSASRPVWPAPAWPFLPFAVALAVALVAGAVRYTLFPGYFDHGEVSLAIRGWQLAHGQPIYRDPSDPQFLLTLYGPTIYGWSALWSKIAGGIAGSKLPGAVAGVAAALVFALHLWRSLGAKAVAPGVALLLALVLMADKKGYWVRPDPASLLLVATGLAVAAGLARDRRWWPAPLALGVVVGLAADVKIHHALFFVPLAFAFLDRRRWLAWLLAAAAAAVVAGSLFLLPWFPPEVYAAILKKAAGGHAVEPMLLLRQANRLVYFFIPVLLLPLAWRRLPGNERAYGLAYAACAAAAIYPASVSGSGWYQMLPLLPLTADLTLRAARVLPGRLATAAMMVPLLAAVGFAWPAQRQVHKFMAESAWTRDAAAEIGEIMARHPGASVEMGFGADIVKTYETSFLRVVPVFAGNPATLDGWSEMEAVYLGMKAPAAKVSRIETCATDLWLIPAGEAPFAMNAYFSENGQFLAPYATAFEQSYELAEQGRFYDVWRCRGRR